MVKEYKRVITTDNSKLISRLVEQKKSMFAGGNNYFTIFEQFSSMVEQELKQINQLFDEYTPHDNTHMNSLFRIADELLGENISKLNGCELCILACAIYGHDWGMAVSDTEKDAIINSKYESEELALLPDEKYLWEGYCKTNGVKLNKNGEAASEDITKDIWREYVRETHSKRARSRCRKYFQEDLVQLGGIIGDVCDAHGNSIEDIRGLSNSRSIAGLIINQRALAVYIRFIDLLDIGNNRTPYALWKYINPQNSKSTMEWRKHQSINPVTIAQSPNDDSKKLLQIHGEVRDVEVYCSLRDMRRYIEVQVKENVDLLLEERDKSLGSIELDWNVITDGSFEPIDIRFDFDRDGMFKLLRNEIYDGDPYIFIRELIQNSVDATSLRIQRLESEGLGITISPQITINVCHQGDGDAVFEIIDSGIGISTDIARDYLAVLGKSYYRSRDYLSNSFEVQPISKFGVGFFSCFEVADKVTIISGTDANLETKENIEIEISNPYQQFRVRKLPHQNDIGTRVKINVKGHKWKKGEFENVCQLDFTQYIKSVVGAIAYPICINEDGIKTTVVPPNFIDDQQEFHSSDSSLYSKCSGSWFKTILDPDDWPRAESLFIEKEKLFSFDKNGLKIKGSYQYFELSEKVLYWNRNTSRGHGIGTVGHTYAVQEGSEVSNIEIHWIDTSNYHPKNTLSKSAKHNLSCQVFMNGILVPEQKINIRGCSGVPNARVLLNITQSERNLDINLARSNIKQPLDQLGKELSVEIFKDMQEICATDSPLDRFSKLTKGGCNSDADSLPDIIPVLKLSDNGGVEFFEFSSFTSLIDIAPRYSFKSQKTRVGWPPECNEWPPLKWLNQPIVDASCIVDKSVPMLVLDTGMEYDDGSCMGWNSYDLIVSSKINKKFINHSYRISSVNQEPYLIERKIFSVDSCDLISKNNLISLSNVEFSRFEGQLNVYFSALRLECNQMSNNRLHKIILNRNIDAVSIFENAISSINNSHDEYDESTIRAVRKVISSMPLIGSIIPYNPSQNYSEMIGKWLQEFCFGCADLGLISLKETERAVLKEEVKSIVCRE